MHAGRLAPALVLALALTAAAQPLPIFDTDTWMCQNATLPLRIATLQPPGNQAIDPAAWVALDEFRTAQAQLSLRRTDPPITVAVLAYLTGDPVDVEVLLTPFGAAEPSWRAVITPDIPSMARGSLQLWPYYLFEEIPRTAWRSAFPRPGPYRLEARPASDPTGTAIEGFCASEAVSWVFVHR
jgi:hypothetical protein